jgi:hypothetical protein
MNHRELASAARHALAHLANENELSRNPLLCENAAPMPHDAARAATLRALESLAPAGTNEAVRKHRRYYDILVRCDVRGEPHKQTFDALGLSRRQFYRERHEALVLLATAIVRELGRVRPISVSLELGDAAEAYIEALRNAGQYYAVWDEARALAVRAEGEPRETKLWIVASEAARYVGDGPAAAEALTRARAAARRLEDREKSYGRELWVAIGDMNQQWAAADFEGMRATLERAVRGGLQECTMQGDEAILFGIMLGYAASMECDCGNWERARDLHARATALAERGKTFTTRSSHLRLSAQLARAQGDVQRSIAEHRTAFDADRNTGQLGAVAVSAVYYAAAVGEQDADRVLPLAEYGLEIAERFYPGDRFARLTLESIGLILTTCGTAAGRTAVARARRAGLSPRDTLFLDLADAKVAAHGGDHAVAFEHASAVAADLSSHGMSAWACDAELTAIESCARLGQRRRARNRLSDFTAAIVGVPSRERARHLGRLLALRA